MITHYHLKEWCDPDYRVHATLLHQSTAESMLRAMREAEPTRRFHLSECASACGYTVSTEVRR